MGAVGRLERFAYRYGYKNVVVDEALQQRQMAQHKGIKFEGKNKARCFKNSGLCANELLFVGTGHFSKRVYQFPVGG